MAKKTASRKVQTRKAQAKLPEFAYPDGRLRVTFRNGLAQIIDGAMARKNPRFSLTQVARIVEAESGKVLFEAAE